MSEYKDIPQSMFEQIEAYLEGSMPPQERAAFAKSLESNEGLRADVAFVKATIDVAERDAMMTQIKEWHSNPAQRPKKQGFNWLALAAGIAILVAAGVWFLLPSSEELNPNDALFAQYAFTDPGLPVPMSASAVRSYAFHDAMVDYKAEKYDVAIEKWNAQLVDMPGNDTLNYYIGSAFFNKAQYDEAAGHFDQVLQTAGSTFADKARLYLVLSYLKMNEAERIGQIVIPENARYADTLQHIVRTISN